MDRYTYKYHYNSVNSLHIGNNATICKFSGQRKRKKDI